MSEPVNENLLTAEELAMPMGAGYAVAAERLGLIYLANVVTLAHVIIRFMEEATKLSEDNAAGMFSSEQLDKAINELTDRLSAILSGRNPRFMATSWFTDPTQLANHLFSMHASFYQSAPYDPCDLTRLRIDPIREESFLLITSAVDGEVWEDTSMEQFITASVRVLLNIPEVVPLEMLQMTRLPTTIIQFGSFPGVRRGS
jgi:hypothetical protein